MGNHLHLGVKGYSGLERKIPARTSQNQCIVEQYTKDQWFTDTSMGTIEIYDLGEILIFTMGQIYCILQTLSLSSLNWTFQAFLLYSVWFFCKTFVFYITIKTRPSGACDKYKAWQVWAAGAAKDRARVETAPIFQYSTVSFYQDGHLHCVFPSHTNVKFKSSTIWTIITKPFTSI